jgi:hypothetical protein
LHSTSIRAKTDNIATVANSYLTDLLAEKRREYLENTKEDVVRDVNYGEGSY